MHTRSAKARGESLSSSSYFKESVHFSIICFETYDDLKYALDKFDGAELMGKRIRLHDDTRKE